MLCLIYISSARNPSGSDLGDILRQSCKNNARNGVTGLLLHAGGNFLQVLEGEAEAVDHTFNKILQDSRHTGVLKLLRFDIAERQFPDWSMALRSLSDLSQADQTEFGHALERWRSKPSEPTVSVEVRVLVENFVSSM